MEATSNEFVKAKVTDIATAKLNTTTRQSCGVSTTIAEKLHTREGDFVLLKSNTASLVLTARQFSARRDVVALDGISRKNLGVEIAQTIQIKGISEQILSSPKVELRIYGVQNPDGTAMADIDAFVQATETEIKNRLRGNAFVDNTLLEMSLPNGFKMSCVVHGSVQPFLIGNETAIAIRIKRAGEGITFEDIGGLDDEIDLVREAVELPIKYPQLFEHMKLKPQRGIILKGPPGTGKTLIVKAVATTAGLYSVFIDGASLMSKFYGETEQRLREKFKEAEENAPSIILIDELDALAPKRGEHMGTVEPRVVAQLLTLMDGIHDFGGDVVVIGTTNRVDDIDPALRRPGRFETEIEIGVPNEEGRRKILEIHLRGTPIKEKIDLDEVARNTHGCVGADLAGLVRKAKYKAIREKIPSIDEEVEVTQPLLDDLHLKQQNLETALKETEPSAMREILTEIPEVKWEDIGGLDDEVMKVKEAVVLPLLKPQKFEELGVKSPSGLLLFGPPGCGKTLVAKAVATESQANFISIKGPELRSKWVGESERAIRMIFAVARRSAPCVIFFDECESIGAERGTITTDANVSANMLSQLLTEMDGVQAKEGVIVIMGTNRPDIMDPAILRHGRIDRYIYIKPPNEDARKQILKIHAKKMKLAKEVNLDSIASKTEAFSGADLEGLCNEAGMLAVREDASCVKSEHFEEALKELKGSISPQMIEFYEKAKEVLGTKKMKVSDKELSNYV